MTNRIQMIEEMETIAERIAKNREKMLYVARSYGMGSDVKHHLEVIKEVQKFIGMLYLLKNFANSLDFEQNESIRKALDEQLQVITEIH